MPADTAAPTLELDRTLSLVDGLVADLKTLVDSTPQEEKRTQTYHRRLSYLTDRIEGEMGGLLDLLEGRP